MLLLMQVAHMETTISQVRTVLYHFQTEDICQGPGGLPAPGERELGRSGDIVYTIPDIQHPDTVARYSGSPGQDPR